MSDLLIELFSEEIPARMQTRAAEELRKRVTDGLVDAGLVYAGAKAYATPRRLALQVTGIPAMSPDTKTERKGPRVGAPDKAIQGFLRGAGLNSINQADVQADPKKGDFYVARTETPGRPADTIIGELMPEIIRGFAWPKSMRWGSGNLRWVRPLHSVLCTFGPETEEPVVVTFDIDGLTSGAVTRGHRFMAPDDFTVRRFDDYVAKLHGAKVVLEAERRRNIILDDAKTLAFAQGLELVEDDGLLAEVAGLVEWPVVLMGAFDEEFLDLPEEVVRTTIRTHQKCFVLRDQHTGKLAGKFLVVSNLEASDGGTAIIEGNERVVRARLSDAAFFWHSDIAKSLDARVPRLDQIIFHEKLGSQGARVERIVKLAGEIAEHTGADVTNAQRAAHLAKADLVTEMVGEFPELQGLMGRYYAEKAGEDPAVAAAIEEHYRPQGPADDVPEEPVAVTVALADKLDLLASFWAIDEKPTGSKDPFALRRAALGIIRILLTRDVRLPLRPVLLQALRRALGDMAQSAGEATVGNVSFLTDLIPDSIRQDLAQAVDKAKHAVIGSIGDIVPETPWETAVIDDLMAFFADRLKVQLREHGARHDLVDAVFALGSDDDLVRVVARVDALGAFLDTDDGQNLLAGYRRAVNIVRAEEKKDGVGYEGAVVSDLLSEAQEIDLANSIDQALGEADTAISSEDFSGAMAALARLRAPVDDFFDAVLVNAEDASVRENRLRLLGRIREATRAVADFDRIEG